jgi:hypothetical protein
VTNPNGTIAELRFIEWLLRRNDDILVPHHTVTSGTVDIAWRNKGRGEHHWVTGQVKKVYAKDGRPTVNVTRGNDGLYHVSDADFLVAVDYEYNDLWIIPFHRVVDATRLVLGKKWEGYRHALDSS